MLRTFSKLTHIYDLAASALSLNRYWDLYSAFLSSLLLRDYENVVTLEELRKMFAYDDWIVVGPLATRQDIDWINKNTETKGVAVADSAFGKAASYGLKKVDLLVTDMDGLEPIHMNINRLYKLTNTVSIHFHGDNIDRAWRFLEVLKMYRIRILPTCQAGVGYKVEKINGFTDGDRAVLLSLIAGAKRISLVGMDFTGYPLPNSLESCTDYKSYFKLKIARYAIDLYSRVYEVKFHNTGGSVYASCENRD
ncbi:MAG: 6-hydroxymethylpterin diphosphokinase MptE-like protein [Fervidicoccaceae archaeon]